MTEKKPGQYYERFMLRDTNGDVVLQEEVEGTPRVIITPDQRVFVYSHYNKDAVAVYLEAPTVHRLVETSNPQP